MNYKAEYRGRGAQAGRQPPRSASETPGKGEPSQCHDRQAHSAIQTARATAGIAGLGCGCQHAGRIARGVRRACLAKSQQHCNHRPFGHIWRVRLAASQRASAARDGTGRDGMAWRGAGARALIQISRQTRPVWHPSMAHSSSSFLDESRGAGVLRRGVPIRAPT